MYIRHPKTDIHENDLGVGLVVEDEVENIAKVFFEKKLKTVPVRTDYIAYQILPDAGDAKLFLDNALIIPGADRQPFPAVLEEFLQRFKGGLKGEVYIKGERNYKVVSSDIAREYFSKDSFAQKIKDKEWSLLAEQIKKAFTVNLLSKFELIKLVDALKLEQNQIVISNCLYDLLHGDSSLPSRIDKAAFKLKEYELDKWPVITYLLFAVFPEKYMFVKPTLTQAAAENRGFDIQYKSQVNGDTYQRVLFFSQDLQQRLLNDSRDELHPRDMIDVQGFMWCTFANGWTDEEIQMFENKLVD